MREVSAAYPRDCAPDIWSLWNSPVAVPDTLGDLLRAKAAADDEARDLSHHVNGFYLEIDKLAKGKAMLEVTPRIGGFVFAICE